MSEGGPFACAVALGGRQRYTPHWPTGSIGDRCDEKRHLNQHAKRREKYEGSKLETRDPFALSAMLTVELVCLGNSNKHLYGSTTLVQSLLECLDMTMIHENIVEKQEWVAVHIT